jgi:predicted nucleotidyltransferase
LTMENILIEEGHLETVKTILRRHLDSTIRVWIFGSRANGTLKKFADLDLALQKTDNTTFAFKTIINLRADFQESDLPWRVDVVDYNTITDIFKNNVDENKILLNLH